MIQKLKQKVVDVKGTIRIEEVFSGVTAGLTAIPTSVAFSVIAGVSPTIGLRGGWIIMLIMGIFGGRTGPIYLNSGAVAVVLAPIVTAHGIGYMFYAVMLAGIIQIVLGILHVNALLRLIPASIMIGFVNGLAILVAVSVLKNFKTDLALGGVGGRRLTTIQLATVFTDGIPWYDTATLIKMGLETGATILLIILSPYIGKYAHKRKVPVFAWMRYLPQILFGLVMITLVEAFVMAAGHSGTPSLDDVAEVDAVWPSLAWIVVNMPPLNLDTFITCIPTAFYVALVGLLESLMTLRLLDKITDTRGNQRREAIMNGVANFITSALGGQGGCTDIGCTITNAKSGGRQHLSSIVSALLVLIIVSTVRPLLGLIPLAGLAGVLLFVAFETFHWRSLHMIWQSLVPSRARACCGLANPSHRITRYDACVIIIVTVVTPLTNLAIAVGCGMVIAALSYAWKSGTLLECTTRHECNVGEGERGSIKTYIFEGQLFFGSVEEFTDYFTISTDPATVKVDLSRLQIVDFSAVQAINELGTLYQQAGKQLLLENTRPASMKTLQLAGGLLEEWWEVSPLTVPSSPHGTIALDMRQVADFAAHAHARITRSPSCSSIDVERAPV